MNQLLKPTTLEQINKRIERERFRNERLWRMREGILYTDVYGDTIPSFLFDKLFPPFSPITYRPKREDIDKTHLGL